MQIIQAVFFLIHAYPYCIYFFNIIIIHARKIPLFLRRHHSARIKHCPVLYVIRGRFIFLRFDIYKNTCQYDFMCQYLFYTFIVLFHSLHCAHSFFQFFVQSFSPFIRFSISYWKIGIELFHRYICICICICQALSLISAKAS